MHSELQLGKMDQGMLCFIPCKVSIELAAHPDQGTRASIKLENEQMHGGVHSLLQQQRQRLDAFCLRGLISLALTPLHAIAP